LVFAKNTSGFSLSTLGKLENTMGFFKNTLGKSKEPLGKSEFPTGKSVFPSVSGWITALSHSEHSGCASVCQVVAFVHLCHKNGNRVHINKA
jgi:hypothetical protein